MENKPNPTKVVDETVAEENVVSRTTDEANKNEVVSESVNNDTENMTVNTNSVESESAAKPQTNKELIAYLAEMFPKCFILKGAAKPLKIGIFQELAEQLVEDNKVSKTRLRQVLRHYTSSWRYLKAIKLGAKRVNLHGDEVAEIDQEQADYASKTLKESQEKFGHKQTDKVTKKPVYKKTQDKSNDKSYKSNQGKSQKHDNKFNTVKSAGKASQEVSKKVAVKLDKIDKADVSIEQTVKVQLGNSAMDAIVKEISGNDVSVELSSGMLVKTKLANLYTESSSTKK
jgi:ProP effector